MARIVRGGLIQATNPEPGTSSVKKIKQAMIEKHIKLIDQAAKKGVQVLCMQEIFYGPYFCCEQEIKWYESTERVPDGPTTKLMQRLAKKHGMVIVAPMYEEESTGTYYNTTAVIDADGKFLGKYRKNHIPHCKPGFWEKFYFKPGNLGYPVFETAIGKVGVYICYDRHFPEGWRLLGLNGAEIVFNPSATTAGLSEYLWKLEQPAARGRQHLLRRRDQPRRHGEAVEFRGVLRTELFRQSARPDHCRRPARQGRHRRRRPRTST